MNASANYNQFQFINYTEATIGVKMSCVPKGFNTEEYIRYLFEYVMGFGPVKSVCFQNNTNEHGQFFISAFVLFHYFNSASNEANYLKGLPYGTSVKFHIPTNMRFEWPDGRGSMAYLSLQSCPLPVQTDNRVPMVLEQGAWTSLHIPVMTEMWLADKNGKKTKFVPRKDLQDFIENKLCIGKVRRIDFVERDDMEITSDGKIQRLEPESDKPESESGVEAAFIHMETWYNNKNATRIRNNINTYSQHHIKGFYDADKNFQQYEFVTSDGINRYFVLKVNHKPIPDASDKLNVHQLSAVITKMEEEALQLKQENAKLVETLAKWEKYESDLLKRLDESVTDAAAADNKYESDLLRRLEEATAADNKYVENYGNYRLESMV